jgi:hypothetical protein
MLRQYEFTNPDGTVVRTADEHLLSTLAHVHAVDHFFMPWVPAYPLASLNIPARQVHVCRCGKEDFGVARPVQIQYCLFVSSQNAVVLA